MKTYTVVWMFVANSRMVKVNASSPANAVERATSLYGSEFWNKASILVFDGEPAMVWGAEAVATFPTSALYKRG